MKVLWELSVYKLIGWTQEEWEKREGEEISKILLKKSSTKKADKFNRKLNKVQREDKIKKERKVNKRGVKGMDSTYSMALM